MLCMRVTALQATGHQTENYIVCSRFVTACLKHEHISIFTLICHQLSTAATSKCATWFKKIACLLYFPQLGQHTLQQSIMASNVTWQVLQASPEAMKQAKLCCWLRQQSGSKQCLKAKHSQLVIIHWLDCDQLDNSPCWPFPDGSITQLGIIIQRSSYSSGTTFGHSSAITLWSGNFSIMLSGKEQSFKRFIAGVTRVHDWLKSRLSATLY